MFDWVSLRMFNTVSLWRRRWKVFKSKAASSKAPGNAETVLLRFSAACVGVGNVESVCYGMLKVFAMASRKCLLWHVESVCYGTSKVFATACCNKATMYAVPALRMVL